MANFISPGKDWKQCSNLHHHTKNKYRSYENIVATLKEKFQVND